MWSVCALSIGKACAAVPACAVVAGVQCGGLAAALLDLVHTLPAVAVYAAAGGPWWRGWYNTLPRSIARAGGPFTALLAVVAGCGLAVLLAALAGGVAGAGVVEWLRVVLPPLRVDHSSRRRCGCWCSISAAPALRALAGGAWRCAGAKSDFQRVAAAVLALPLWWWLWRASNPRRLGGGLHVVTALPPLRAAWWF